MKLISRLRKGLRRTAAQLGKRFDEIIGHSEVASRDLRRCSETIETLEELLLQSDVGVTATERIISSVRSDNGFLPGTDLRQQIRSAIVEILSSPKMAPPTGALPRVILVVGVNGTGKTTTVGKLAGLLGRDGHNPLICAADTFRAAAVEQLEVWAKRAGVGLVKARPGGDPAAIVFDAIAAGRARGLDIVLVDTAGRLHTRSDLMAELEKIQRVASREVVGAPHEILLVLDATVGQNGLTQARRFLEYVRVTGIVLTKIDGTAKGGIAIAVTLELGIPIRYVGVGESLDDLLPFSGEEYVDALFAEQW